MAKETSLDVIRKILDYAEEGMSPTKIQIELKVKYGIILNQSSIIELLTSQPKIFFQIEGKWKVRIN
jgi:hypothetical protein